MDNTLYIYDTNHKPSTWWITIVDKHFLGDRVEKMLELFNEHSARVIQEDKRMIGLEFPSDKHKTAFLLKYG